jgi:hypothetical protein
MASFLASVARADADICSPIPLVECVLVKVLPKAEGTNSTTLVDIPIKDVAGISLLSAAKYLTGPQHSYQTGAHCRCYYPRIAYIRTSPCGRSYHSSTSVEQEAIKYCETSGSSKNFPFCFVSQSHVATSNVRMLPAAKPIYPKNTFGSETCSVRSMISSQ